MSISTSAVSLAMVSMISLCLAFCVSRKSVFTIWKRRSVSQVVVWSCELGALARVLATDKASLRSFLSLSILWIESELWVAGSGKRKLGMPGFSSFSESSSSISVSMRLSSALAVGRTLLALGVVGSSVASGVAWRVLSCWGGGFCVGCGMHPFHP